MELAAVFLLWVSFISGLVLWVRRLGILRQTRERVFDVAAPLPAGPTVLDQEEQGWLRWWLFRAGYRTPSALPVFLTFVFVTSALGLLAGLLLHLSGLPQQSARLLGIVPGGVGDLFLPLVYLAPWAAFLIPTSLPWLWVRAVRRRRVAQVEQDLPITLELLATLGEAGLGFDAALERILASQSGERPLAQEFRLFQLEILAGRPRVQCLRRLGRRLDVSALTIFISALVQADQVGAGTADVLRRQADELRSRRREDALTKAAALPVKLLFPLVICFLPGIMVAALGPAFYQIFQFLEGLTRTGGLP